MGLAQVFTVTMPLGGVSTVTVSSVSLYFKSISNTNGIDIQLREVANGMPTYNIVKNSRVSARPTDKYANGASVLKASTNGSSPSTFTFQKPVQLKAQSQYAIMVLPHASDPAYGIWSATANAVDQTTNVPIQFNGAVGPLITWDPGGGRTVLTGKALKFLVNKGFANTARYHDDSYNFNEEHIIVNKFTAPFVIGESCYMSQDNLNFAAVQLYVPLLSGVFTQGENFYQIPGGGRNTITGTIYHANDTVLLLSNTSAPIDNTKPIFGVLSGANAWITTVNSSVICSNTSNTITFPYTGNGSSSIFYANQSIFLTSSDQRITQPFIVTSVGNNSIQVSWKPVFSDVNCSAGLIRGDKLALKMDYQGYDGIKENNFVATFNNSRANTQINQNFHFANSVGKFIIGQSSRARCVSYGTVDLEYHCVIPQFHFDQAEENEHSLYWGGYRSYSNFTSQYPAVWRYIIKT